ncbi:unnamed protein product [Urochloa decumbens]|uniref:Uncharacterized protein n=1 Tax=Urochloa decumbens TaxID=240449 RepID=A0ABC9B4E6_9POAL
MPSSTNPSAALVSPAAGADTAARRSDSDVPSKILTMDVSNYSVTKKVGNGCGIKSPRLDAGGKSWRIIYYPNGKRAGTTESISLYLRLDTAGAADGVAAGDDDEDVEVLYKFILPGPDAGIRFMSGEVVSTFNRLRKNAHGFERFITRDDLEKSGCVRNDYFNVRCDVTVLSTACQRTTSTMPEEPSLATALPSKPQHPTPSSVAAADDSGRPGKPCLLSAPPSGQLHEPSVTAVPAASGLQGSSLLMEQAPGHPREQQQSMADVLQTFLPKDLGRLLATKEGQGADVDFEVGGMVFAAHRCVLAARSPVFKDDFFGPTKEENTSYIRINDMNPKTFQALLHYIYTDSLPEMNDQEVGAMAHHLLSAADRFGLKGLKSIMENRLCTRVCVTNALATLVLAEQHQCHELRNSCFRFIACPENDREVMATDDVEHLAKSCPSIVKELITEILDSREVASNGKLSLRKEME